MASGFFTLGISPDEYQLPHDRLGLPTILLVRRVVSAAFDQLRKDQFDLAAAKEKQVTAALLAVIENKLRQQGTIPGFNRRTFEPVGREAEFANFDGSKLEKSPDLCFRLRRDESAQYRGIAEYDALFVECKPIDKSHSAGSKYCDDGLVRFVCGDYGWAMQEGMMLGYARDGRTIQKHLTPELLSRKVALSVTKDLSTVRASAAAAQENAEAMHVSNHQRKFEWLGNKGPACEITIYHLWHDCS